MKTETLREFIVLCACDSMHEAAKRLYMSQPTLSAHISELELEVGRGKPVKLVERDNRCTPTEAGRLFLHTARKVLADLDEGLNRIEALAPPSEGGVVRVAFPQVSTSLAKAMDDLPLPRYEFVPYDIGRGPLAPLLDGKADVMSLFNLDTFPEIAAVARENGLSYRPAYRVHMALLMMASNPLASIVALAARDLYGVTAAMMGPDHIEIAERLDASILGFDPGFRYTYRSVSSPEGMMRLDLGDALALVSLDSVSPYLASRPDIVLRETVDGKPLVEQRCLVWNPAQASPEVETFVERFVAARLLIDR